MMTFSKNQLLSLIAFIACLFISHNSIGQKIEIFADTTAHGKGLGKGVEFTVLGKRSGTKLHMKYSEKPAIQEPKMYLFIDRKMPLGNFIEHDTYKLEVPEGAKDLSTSYVFKEVGVYAVSFTDADKNVVATDTINLRYDQKVIFCDAVKKGKPVNERTEVLPSKTGLYYYVILLKGSRPLDTHQMIIHIYQHDGKGFNKHIGEYKRYVEYSRKQTSFRGLFLDSGHYKVEVFKFNGEPYAEAYLHLVPLEE